MSTHSQNQKQTRTADIDVTQTAAQKAKEMRDSNGLEGHAVRLRAEGGGCCSEPTYELWFDDEVDETDYVVEADGIRFVVDESSHEAVEGGTVEFVRSRNGAGFDVDNPNFTEESCSCGTGSKSGSCGCGSGSGDGHGGGSCGCH